MGALGHGQRRQRSFVPGAQRQRRARLDRKRIGRWPHTPDSDNAGDVVHPQ